MLSTSVRLRLQEILTRLSKNEPVSLDERILVQKYADRNSTVWHWLRKARSIQAKGHLDQQSVGGFMQQMNLPGQTARDHFNGSQGLAVIGFLHPRSGCEEVELAINALCVHDCEVTSSNAYPHLFCAFWGGLLVITSLRICLQRQQILIQRYDSQGGKEDKMLNEMLLSTTLCVAIVGIMALFRQSSEMLQNNQLASLRKLVPMTPFFRG